MTDDHQPAPLSAEEIAAIRARAEAATPGPWRTWPEGTEESVESESLGRFVCHLNSNMLQFREDSAFIAHAREDIPRLLATLDAEQARTVDLNVGMDEQWVRANQAERERDALRAALEQAERETRAPSPHITDPVAACQICDQEGPMGGAINHAPDCPFAALAAGAEGEGGA